MDQSGSSKKVSQPYLKADNKTHSMAEGGVYAASTHAHQLTQKVSNAPVNPSIEAT